MISFISSVCVDDTLVIGGVEATAVSNIHAERTPREVRPIGEGRENILLSLNSSRRIKMLGEEEIMPWPKGRTFSEEHRRKLSLAKKGKKKSMEHQRKITESLKGNKISEETRRKISLACTGRRLSEETKRRMSFVRRGKKASLEAKRKLSEVRKAHPIMAMKGKHLADFMTEETRIERIRKLREARLKQVFPKVDTQIEALIQKELTRRGITFKTHVPLLRKYQVDIVISNLVVECDGDYWHNYPYGLEKDCKRDKELREAGYQVFHFWGHEIKQDVEGCVNKLEQVVKVSQVVGERAMT